MNFYNTSFVLHLVFINKIILEVNCRHKCFFIDFKYVSFGTFFYFNISTLQPILLQCEMIFLSLFAQDKTT